LTHSVHSGRQKDQSLRTCDERGQQVWGEEIDCKRVFESVDRLTTRGVRTKDPRVVNDGLERSGGVGLIRESTGLFEASEITCQRRAGAGHATQRLLGTLLVAPMHHDVMA